jgi:PIN domain nuclease of toxin-antitoxin system
VETASMIYIDTHVVLWLYHRKGEGLSERARRLIEYEPEILIYSNILMHKLAFKHAKNRS